MGWGDWGDVPACICDSDRHPQINSCKSRESFLYKQFSYTVQPNNMVVDNGETWHIYLTAHLGNDTDGQCIEAGAQMHLALSKPEMFSCVSFVPDAFKAHPEYSWEWNEEKRFTLKMDPDTGYYEILYGGVTLREGSGMRPAPCMADMCEEYFGTCDDGRCTYSESGKDVIKDGWLKEEGGAEYYFDYLGTTLSCPFCPELRCRSILNGLESWYEC